MKKVCKIRFYPNKTQINKINEILGICRWARNLYIQYNQELYEKDKSFLSGYEFSKMINKMKKNDPNYYWVNNCGSKALKDAIMAQEKSYKNFFRKIRNHEACSSPRFISRKKLTKESFFFIKDQIHFDTGKKNIIKIPILHDIRITERNYLPDKESITSGRVIVDHDKYYVMFIYDIEPKKHNHTNIGYGCDLGIKNYATLYSSIGDYIKVPHFKDNERYKEYERKIKRLQQIISYKAEMNYGRLLNDYLSKHDGEYPSEKYKNIMKGESYHTSNIKKLQKKIYNLKQKQTNIAHDFIHKLVYRLVVRTKPLFITIEDLSISDLLENDSDNSLHRYIALSAFYYFRQCVTNKSKEYPTEIRVSNRYYASSKKCTCCGYKNKDLKLTDRLYICPNCQNIVDRDLNASMNLLHTKDYVLA